MRSLSSMVLNGVFIASLLLLAAMLTLLVGFASITRIALGIWNHLEDAVLPRPSRPLG